MGKPVQLPPTRSTKLQTSTSYDKFQHHHFNQHVPVPRQQLSYRRPPAFEMNQSSFDSSISELSEHKSNSPSNKKNEFKRQLSSNIEKNNEIMDDMLNEMEHQNKKRRSKSKSSLRLSKNNKKHVHEHRKSSSFIPRPNRNNKKKERKSSLNLRSENKKERKLSAFSNDFFSLRPQKSNLSKRKSADFTNQKIKRQNSYSAKKQKQPKISIDSCLDNGKHSGLHGLIMQSMTSPTNVNDAQSEISNDSLFVPRGRTGTVFKRKNYTLPPPAHKHGIKLKKNKKSKSRHQKGQFSL